MIDGVENVDRAAASDCHDCGPDLSPERPAVGQRNQAGAIDQSLQLRGYISDVGWGAEDHSIGYVDLFQVIVHFVLLDGAPPVPLLEALEAGQATPHGFSADLPVVGAPAGSLQGFEHLLEHDLRIAARLVNADVIVTRNTVDFKPSSIPVPQPRELGAGEP